MGQQKASERTILSVDPGRSKCGLAVVSGPPATTHCLKVVATEDLIVEIGALLRAFASVDSIIIGDGTKCHVLKRAIASMFPDRPLTVVNEKNSSERARAVYLQRVDARGWQRILPMGLRTPDRPVDDIVAELLAKDFLESLPN